MMPSDFPPREAVYLQTQRWMDAGVLESMVCDAVLRLAQGRVHAPSAAVLNRRRKGRSTLGGRRFGVPLALGFTPAAEQDRAQVGAPAEDMREATGEGVDLAYVD